MNFIELLRAFFVYIYIYICIYNYRIKIKVEIKSNGFAKWATNGIPICTEIGIQKSNNITSGCMARVLAMATLCF